MFPFYFPRQESDPEPDAQPDPDPDGVGEWRVQQLIAAGWDDLLAGLLAADLTVDLHRACELLEGGCDQATAWEILS